MNAKSILRGSGGLLLGVLGLILLLAATVVGRDVIMRHGPLTDDGVEVGPAVGTLLLFLVASASFIILSAHQMRLALKAPDKTESSAKPTVESRLDELERLKRREMVTPEEYAAKRQEILKDL
jgi:hypothetical protein